MAKIHRPVERHEAVHLLPGIFTARERLDGCIENGPIIKKAQQVKFAIINRRKPAVCALDVYERSQRRRGGRTRFGAGRDGWNGCWSGSRREIAADQAAGRDQQQ